MAHADSLGRTFLTVAHNKFERNSGRSSIEEYYATRVDLDIEGNQRAVIDAKDRVVMRYDYDMLGNRIHQASMEAGERWMLNDVRQAHLRLGQPRSSVPHARTIRCAARWTSFLRRRRWPRRGW